MTDSLGNTWNSEWNLVCDKKHLKIVAEMIFLMGVATGGLLAGMLSDKFGRKKMLFISAVFQSFFGKILTFLYSVLQCVGQAIIRYYFHLNFKLLKFNFNQS